MNYFQNYNLFLPFSHVTWSERIQELSPSYMVIILPCLTYLVWFCKETYVHIYKSVTCKVKELLIPLPWCMHHITDSFTATRRLSKSKLHKAVYEFRLGHLGHQSYASSKLAKPAIPQLGFSRQHVLLHKCPFIENIFPSIESKPSHITAPQIPAAPSGQGQSSKPFLPDASIEFASIHHWTPTIQVVVTLLFILMTP